MYESPDCPVCAQPAAQVAHGVLAPWISALFDLPSPRFTQLRACAGCGMRFFSSRYTDDEMGRLYSGYRGSEYVAIRRRWEPWYRDSVNNAFEPGSPATRKRLQFMERTLDEAASGRDWEYVVDVGGDAGQFFPPSASGRRVLIDPSSKPLPAGIERVERLGDLGGSPDLVLMAHVLEHLPDPLAELRGIREVLAPGGRVYVEVPWDLPRTSQRVHPTAGFRRWLGAVSRTRPTFVAADFVAGAARQYRVSALPLPTVKQSEHINYFDPESLANILGLAGFKPEVIRSDQDAAPAGLRLGLIAAVAAATPAGPPESTMATSRAPGLAADERQ